MKKGKTRTRNARVDLLKRNASNARRKARQHYDRQETRAKVYEKQSYDKPQSVDPSPA
jgi:hypothetical protein